MSVVNHELCKDIETVGSLLSTIAAGVNLDSTLTILISVIDEIHKRAVKIQSSVFTNTNSEEWVQNSLRVGLMLGLITRARSILKDLDSALDGDHGPHGANCKCPRVVH